MVVFLYAIVALVLRSFTYTAVSTAAGMPLQVIISRDQAPVARLSLVSDNLRSGAYIWIDLDREIRRYFLIFSRYFLQGSCIAHRDPRPENAHRPYKSSSPGSHYTPFVSPAPKYYGL